MRPIGAGKNMGAGAIGAPPMAAPLQGAMPREPSGSQGPGHGGGVAGGGAALPLGRHPKRGDG